MSIKPLRWIASSKKDLSGFPEDVQRTTGYALHLAQTGEKATFAKPLKGLGSGVFEVVDDYNADTYRAVYAVQFEDAIYVLHCFQKKSKSGIKTPKQDIDLIKARLKTAQEDHNARKRELQ